MKNMSTILTMMTCAFMLMSFNIGISFAKPAINSSTKHTLFTDSIYTKITDDCRKKDNHFKDKLTDNNAFTQLIFVNEGVKDGYVPHRLRWIKINNEQWKITRVR